jgi:hypothetical protein
VNVANISYVISNVPDKKVIDPKPASRQGKLDTTSYDKIVFYPDTQLSFTNRNDVYIL